MFLMNFKLNISCHLAQFSPILWWISDPDLIEAETALCLEQEPERGGGAVINNYTNNKLTEPSPRAASRSLSVLAWVIICFNFQ